MTIPVDILGTALTREQTVRLALILRFRDIGFADRVTRWVFTGDLMPPSQEETEGLYAAPETGWEEDDGDDEA